MTTLIAKLTALFARKPELSEALQARLDALEVQRRRADLMIEKRAAAAG
ncbi:MAG: hypothetical protein AAGA87_13085 [Pseudomonadota bacterium]